VAQSNAGLIQDLGTLVSSSVVVTPNGPQSAFDSHTFDKDFVLTVTGGVGGSQLEILLMAQGTTNEGNTQIAQLEGFASVGGGVAGGPYFALAAPDSMGYPQAVCQPFQCVIPFTFDVPETVSLSASANSFINILVPALANGYYNNPVSASIYFSGFRGLGGSPLPPGLDISFVELPEPSSARLFSVGLMLTSLTLLLFRRGSASHAPRRGTSRKQI
jgi:hypothetical protein